MSEDNGMVGLFEQTIRAIKDAAFSIPPPNDITPRLVQIATSAEAALHVALARQSSDGQLVEAYRKLLVQAVEEYESHNGKVLKGPHWSRTARNMLKGRQSSGVGEEEIREAARRLRHLAKVEEGLGAPLALPSSAIEVVNNAAALLERLTR
jgi:hypothetical protein